MWYLGPTNTAVLGIKRNRDPMLEGSNGRVRELFSLCASRSSFAACMPVSRQANVMYARIF